VTAAVGACLVDVWDTLVVPEFEVRIATITAWLGVDADAWREEWLKGRDDRDRGKLTVEDSLALTLRTVGREPLPALVADLRRLDVDLMREHCRLFDDSIGFLTGLRSRDIKIAIVSNCADTTRGLLDYLGVIPLADAVVLSCEVGAAKPFPEIYRQALDDLGVAAADAIFVDDQPSFCAGAEAIGVRAIQITRGDPDGRPASAAAFPAVRTLLDAPRYF